MMADLARIHQEAGGCSARVIHIAGSKGKGSTAHLLARLLAAQGRRVGLFTSPALFGLEECVQINGKAISSERLAELMAGFDEGLSEFERLTLAALLHFKDCDEVVLECGWGGARDATNMVAEKALTILTHVELEHTEQLGRTIAEISREKLGICRPGVPLLTPAAQRPEVFEVMQAMGMEPVLVEPMTRGHLHPESVGLAVRAMEALGYPMNEGLFDALEGVRIPGRFEIGSCGPHTLIFDGAHTRDSVAYLKDKVDRYAREQGFDAPWWALHFLSDKAPDLWQPFPPERSVWVALEDVRAGRAPDALLARSPEEFVEELKQKTTPRLVCVVGSFRLVAAVQKAMEAA